MDRQTPSGVPRGCTEGSDPGLHRVQISAENPSEGKHEDTKRSEAKGISLHETSREGEEGRLGNEANHKMEAKRRAGSQGSASGQAKVRRVHSQGEMIIGYVRRW